MSSKLKMNQCREYWEAGEDTNEKKFETERAGRIEYSPQIRLST